jgi:hypothetical protein
MHARQPVLVRQAHSQLHERSSSSLCERCAMVRRSDVDYQRSALQVYLRRYTGFLGAATRCTLCVRSLWPRRRRRAGTSG